MNLPLIFYIVGWMLNTEALFMAPSILVSLIYGESCSSLLISALICLGCGAALTIRKPQNRNFTLKEGYLSAALVWIIMSLTGMLPFLLSRSITDPVEALFEAMSGFTTTGASILSDIEALPHGVFFWRSTTHWIGGMGVLVFLIAIIPLFGGSKMNLMKAESPGPSITRILPTAKETAGALYKIYIGMTLLQILLLLAGGMPAFDALTITFGTAGTGGFGVLNDSCASYSAYSQIVITVFMILFSINFNAYFYLLRRKWKESISIEEVRWYLLIIAAATAVIAFSIRDLYSSTGQTILQAAFQAASIISTTGFSTTDFGIWPVLACEILILLMFIGACSGSTGGGFKVCRIVVLVKTLGNELLQYIYPGSVRQVRMDGKKTEDSVRRSIHVFLAAYVMIFIVSVLLISITDHYDFLSNFTAVAATIGNIGPGLGEVGPASNFSGYSDFSQLVLIFDMPAGRLEIFPVLLLLYPPAWKRF
ncbi:MAG: TrkH family potassium uptake protein [Firmicutes bacterium]|nr:TrkH family potassium uptake protein [Bacillota bacterium]